MESFIDQSILYQNLTEDEMKDLQIALSSKYITISGIITELNENGLQPSVNATVIIKSGGAGIFALQTVTDIQGKFVFQASRELPEDTFESFFINVTKPNFEPLSIGYKLPSDSTRTNIALQITKIVNYFPLKVGNTWEYEVYIYDGDVRYWEKEGVQVYEITSVDGLNFTMDAYFTGIMIYTKDGQPPPDTTYHNNEKTTLSCSIDNGYLKTDGGRWHISESYYSSFKIKCIHPLTSDGMINYSFEDTDKRESYNLKFQTGILNIEINHISDVWWLHTEKWNLLNFTEGE